MITLRAAPPGGGRRHPRKQTPRLPVPPDTRPQFGLYLLLAAAYVGGLLVPLMNNDSAHHAVIALRMYLTGDYAALVTQGRDYLDKPHLLFWLAAAGYHVLGVTTLAYKLPSLLFSVLAVYSTWRLGRLLYSPAVGRLAALVLASSLAFILANNDVRMDAVLTATIVFAIWQMADFVEFRRARNLVLAGLGLALGFATKGMIGVAMPGIAIFLHLAYRRDWRTLFSPAWLVLALITALFAAPVLVAYHQQFGTHGVTFILWSQNFERLAGERFGAAGRSDPLFFFHTFLWAFLPWSLLAAAAVWQHARAVLRARLRPAAGLEMLTLGTIAVMFVIISSSSFKLPHYLNILLPLFSVLLAAWLAPRMAHPVGRGVRIAQALVWGLLAVLAVALNGWAFPVERAAVALGAAALALIGGVLVARAASGLPRVITASVVVAAVFHFLLAFNFYPQLLRHQAGNNLAAAVHRLGVPTDAVHYLAGHGRASSFDFYTARLTPSIELDELRARTAPTLIYTSTSGRRAIEAAGLRVEELARNPEFRVTRLNARFLDPKRRDAVIDEHFILRVDAGGGQ